MSVEQWALETYLPENHTSGRVLDFFDFLILAALALPAIMRWLGDQSRKGQPEAETPAHPPAKESSGESEFERALREIGRALGSDSSEPEHTVQNPVPASAPTRAPASRREPEETWREESFETGRSDALRKARTEPFRRLKLRRIEIPSVAELDIAPRSAAPRVKALLHTPSSARDAVAFSEVLRAPLALRDAEDR